VDSKKIKSIYLNIQSWAEPKNDMVQNWDRVVLNLSRSVKHQVLEIIDRILFEDCFIVDLDLRTSGILHGKKSFMNLEITLYLKESVDFKSQIIKSSIKKMSSDLYVNNITKNNYFNFSITKKDNPVAIFVES